MVEKLLGAARKAALRELRDWAEGRRPRRDPQILSLRELLGSMGLPSAGSRSSPPSSIITPEILKPCETHVEISLSTDGRRRPPPRLDIKFAHAVDAPGAPARLTGHFRLHAERARRGGWSRR